MTEDNAIEHMVPTNVIKVSSIVFEFEDVVIAFDKHLASVEPVKDAEKPTIDHNIAKVVHTVIPTNPFVVASNHSLVHFFCRSKRPERSTICPFEYGTGFFVPKVLVTPNPCC
jgi:hypothetical protein